MNKKIAVIGIIVENIDSVDALNSLLHNYGDVIIGRLGIPYKEKSINVISVAVDAEDSIIAELSQKISELNGVTSNVAVSGE